VFIDETIVGAGSAGFGALQSVYGFGVGQDFYSWNVSYDQIFAYNRALSNGEVSRLYNAGSGLAFSDSRLCGGVPATPTPSPSATPPPTPSTTPSLSSTPSRTPIVASPTRTPTPTANFRILNVSAGNVDVTESTVSVSGSASSLNRVPNFGNCSSPTGIAGPVLKAVNSSGTAYTSASWGYDSSSLSYNVNGTTYTYPPGGGALSGCVNQNLRGGNPNSGIELFQCFPNQGSSDFSQMIPYISNINSDGTACPTISTGGFVKLRMTCTVGGVTQFVDIQWNF
jgi:hypothetical protein